MKRAIVEGSFKSKERIASERELCRILDVSHITVRQSLNELTQEGFLMRVPGKGTFVAEQKDEQGLSVGLVIPETVSPISSYFITNVLYGMKRVLRRSGYALQIIMETETGYLKSEGRGGLRGVVLTDPQVKDARFGILKEQGFPFVVIGNPKQEGIPFVDNDNVKAGYIMAASCFAGGAAKHAAFLNSPSHWTVSEDREKGFRKACEEFGVKATVEYGRFDEESGYACARKVLSFKPDALLCGDDLIAIGAVRALREAGISIPSEVAVACCGNSQFTQYMEPPLTAVEFFPGRIGELSAEKLLSIISGQSVEDVSLVDVKAVERASSSHKETAFA